MKKLLYILSVLFFISGSANAQDLVKDFFKKQSGKEVRRDSTNNKPALDSIYVAPIDSSKVVKIAQKSLLKDTVDVGNILNNLFVLRQDYCLVNKVTKKRFGYEGEDFFGSTYSIGIKCDGYNVVTDEAISPWEYDEKYDYFKKKVLEPKITNSKYLLLSNTKGNYVKLESVVEAKYSIKEDYLYACTPFSANQEGLTVNNSDTCNTGILVWVVNDGKLPNDIEIRVEQKPMKVEMVGIISVDAPSRAMFGLYMVKTGTKAHPYQLAGIVTQRKDRWSLCFPFKGFTYNQEKKEKAWGKLTEIKK